MNNVKLLRGKFSITTILSLVLLVIGIGFICWTMINIREQARHFDDIYLSPSSSQSASVVKQLELMIDDKYKIELDIILYP